MDKETKFLRKLGKFERQELEKWIPRVLANDLGSKKAVKLKGFENLFRIRIGKFRIVFERWEEKNKVVNIDYRRDVDRDI